VLLPPPPPVKYHHHHLTQSAASATCGDVMHRHHQPTAMHAIPTGFHIIGIIIMIIIISYWYVHFT